MNILINDWQTWIAYRQSTEISPSEVIWTASPSVLEALSGSHDIRDLTEDVTASDLNDLGTHVQEISKTWIMQINRSCMEAMPGVNAGTMLGAAIPICLSSLTYYALLLERFRKSGAHICVPYIASKPSNNLFGKPHLAIAPMITNFMAWLIQNPDSEYNAELVPCELQPETRSNTGLVSDSKSLRPRIEDFLVRLSSVRVYYTKYMLFFTLTGNNFLGRLLQKYSNDRYRIFFYRITSQIISLVPWLAMKNMALKKVVDPNIKLRSENVTGIGISDVLDNSLQNKAQHQQLMKRVLQTAAIRLEMYINNVLIPANNQISEYVNSLQNELPKGVKAVLLTNGLASPDENLFAHHFGAKGITVIYFQHGPSGLMENYRTFQHYSDMARCDAYSCYNAYEEKFYCATTGDTSVRFFAQGAWQTVASPYPPIARFLVRRKWKIRSKKPVVLYAPTRLREGDMWLPYCAQDMKYWKSMKDLVLDVYGKSNIFGIIKIHQKGINGNNNRTLYNERMQPWEFVKLPENVKLEYWPDLTYSRHAADIIVIDRATSVIGWALSADKPLVYIDFPENPLVSEVRGPMKDALFVFDMADKNWKSELREFFDLSYSEILRQWKTKKEARKTLSENYILGPDRPIKELGNWVLKQAS